MLRSLFGAHLLLQVRTHVLNDDLATDFARWYPTRPAREAAEPIMNVA
ncbi:MULTISPECIES: hypothetical protein [Pseudofrankia]|nr:MULTISPECIES: hypothetical protein [Pseudofrankia]